MNKANESAVNEKALVAFIACAGTAGRKTYLARGTSCAEAAKHETRRGECGSGCLACGDCAKACPKGAIIEKNGRMVVDTAKCDGCGDCAKEGVCPRGLIRMIPADATCFIPCSSTEEDEQTVREICGFGCISCGECERACPQDAVHIVDNHAVIDYDKCVGCEMCTVKCRKKIIVNTYHNLAEIKNQVAFVRCSGDGRSFARIREMGIYNCEDARDLDLKGLGLCTTGCLGQGTCVGVCRYDAVSVVNGIAKVDPEKCVGCKDCTFACPQRLITIVPYKGMKMVACSSKNPPDVKAKVCSTGCTFCQDCVNNCPNGAIYTEGQHAVIDPAKCENCNVCRYVCSTGVIREQAVPEYIYAQRDALEEKRS